MRSSGVGIVFIIVLVIVGVSAWALYRPTSNRPEGADWQVFSSEPLPGGWRFSLRHPHAVEVTHPRDAIYTFTYLGRHNEAGTEIRDGFLLTITAEPAARLPAYLAAQSARETKPTELGGRPAQRYEARTALGNTVTHTVLSLPAEQASDTIIDITTAAMGSSSPSYQQTIDRMLDTLSFTAPDSATERDTRPVYTNTRYSYTISYPTSFVPQGESQNGDGEVFAGSGASLRVFGTHNIAHDSLRDIALAYFGASGVQGATGENTSGVTLRAQDGDRVRAVRVIPLADDAVGIAVLQYADSALSEGAAQAILESFTRGSD